MTMKDLIFVICQYLVPQHLLSRLAGWFAESRVPWIKNTIIRHFIRHYRVDMSEAAQADYRLYKNFNAFFTRALKEDVRPLAGKDETLVSPVDGYISQSGNIESGRILQAKGQDYALLELLGGDETMAAYFTEGKFATLYLSPKNYHRVHMPCSGELKRMIYVPGQLFSVNNATAENVARLFARNERLVCLFETNAGPMALILVGAMIVAGIETVWAGQVTPMAREIKTTEYESPLQAPTLEKGAEMGRFKLGSTVIVLFGPNCVEWSEALNPGAEIVMGQALGKVIKGGTS